MKVISDALATAKHGYSRTSDCLDMLFAIENEDDSSVLKEISSCLDELENVCCGDMLEYCKRIRLSIFFPKIQKLGWEYSKDEPFEISRIRTLSIIAVARARHPDTLKEYRERMVRFIVEKNESVIDANLIEYGMKLFLMESSDSEHDFHLLKSMYDSSSNEKWSNFALMALGSAPSIILVERLLWVYANNPGIIRSVDVVDLLRGIVNSRGPFRNELRPLLNKWMQDNWGKLCERYNQTVILAKIVGIVVGFGSGRGHIEQIKDFQRANEESFVMAETQLSQALERVELDNAWRENLDS